MNLRSLTPNDFTEWAELLAVCFNRTPSDMLKLLAWLHRGNPVVAWGAWDGKSLVAQYASMLVSVYVPALDHPIQAGLSLNMAVHPDFRGQGLIKQVSKPVYETVQDLGGVIGVGFSNATGVKVDKHSQSYGYRVVGRMIPTLVWLGNYRSSVGLTLCDDLPDSWFAVGCNTLFLELPTSSHIHFVQKEESILHRYVRHPLRRYQYGVWRDGQTMQGLVVYRCFPIGGQLGVSLFYACSQRLDELLDRWFGTLRAQGIICVHVLTTPQSNLRSAVARLAKSIRVPYSRSLYYLTVKPLVVGISQSLFDFSAWDCIGGNIL